MVYENGGWRRFTDMVRFYPSAVHRRRLIVKWLAPTRPRSILDVGCGPAHLFGALHDAFPDACYTGLDSDEGIIEINRARFPAESCRFERRDIQREHLAER